MIDFIQYVLYIYLGVAIGGGGIAAAVSAMAWIAGEFNQEQIEKIKTVLMLLAFSIIGALGILMILASFGDDSKYRINVIYVDDNNARTHVATGIFDSKAACSTERNTVQINSDNTVVFCSKIEEPKGDL